MLRSKEIGAATNKDGDLQGYCGNPGRGERVYGVSRGVLTTPYQPVLPGLSCRYSRWTNCFRQRPARAGSNPF